MNENRNSGCWLFEIHHLVPFTVLADWIKHCSWWAGTQFSRYHISSLLVSADRPLMDCITLWSLHPHDRCCWPPDLWVVLIPTLLQPFTFPSSSFHTCSQPLTFDRLERPHRWRTVINARVTRGQRRSENEREAQRNEKNVHQLPRFESSFKSWVSESVDSEIKTRGRNITWWDFTGSVSTFCLWRLVISRLKLKIIQIRSCL